ncbi:MAG: hypothetical protein J5854_08150 [Clostridia bacterium]|nr:hypothetical protein [Clostridia bacterium]
MEKKRKGKFITGALFTLAQWTWGLPQNLVGAALALVFRGRRFRYHGALVTVYRSLRGISNNSGFSLGSFIFMPEAWSDHDREHILVHEYGHSVQSLILGPFYLPVVGLPSVIWSRRYSKKRSVYRDRGIKYTDRFPENEADRLGEAVTGEKPY